MFIPKLKLEKIVPEIIEEVKEVKEEQKDRKVKKNKGYKVFKGVSENMTKMNMKGKY